MMRWNQSPRRMAIAVLLSFLLLSGIGFFSFLRFGQVRSRLSTINKFYVPVIKNLNVLQGKWSAYQRSFEQTVAFRKWGASPAQAAQEKAQKHNLKLNLKRMIDQNVEDFERLISGSMKNEEVVQSMASWLKDLKSYADAESSMIIEISAAVGGKNYSQAAQLYANSRSQQLQLTQRLIALNHAVDAEISRLQQLSEDQLASAQTIFLTMLAFALALSAFALIRVRRWITPMELWTDAARDIALRGLQAGTKLPQISADMPEEMQVLTREFNRMAFTVLEREKTIHQQKNKLELLNQHLHSQNDLLRRLGALNERVLNSMTAGLLVVSPDGRVEQFNERFCSIFQVERNRLLGADATALLTAIWGDDRTARWLASASPIEERRVPRENRCFDVVAQPLLQGESTMSGKLFIFDDVTADVEAEKRLAHAEKIILAGHLSSQVAHEVRNPLNSMGLQLEMLREDLDAGESASAVSRVSAVEEQVGRLERLTERYLSLGTEKKIERDEHVDMHSVIERCLEFLSAEIQSHRIQIILELEAKNSVVRGNSDSLYQVVFNLIKNSVEALVEQSPEGERSIRVNTANLGPELRICLSDTGPGLPARVRERLFEPFVTEKASGNGLGLSISRQICLEHGGDLMALNRTDSGAIFTICLKS